MNVRQHRTRFFDASDGALSVFTAYDEMQLSGDMAAPFLQESTFFWLTGMTEPGWRLILDSSRRQATLVRPERSQVQLIFDGSMSDQEVTATSGIDDIIAARDFETTLRQLSRHHTVVATLGEDRDHGFVLNPAPLQLKHTLERIFVKVVSCRRQIAELRAIKSAEEIADIRRAIALTSTAFAEAREQLSSYQHEYEVEADMTRLFRRSGAAHAYEPIVASGSHAVTLHYTANKGKLAANKLLLIDVGARVNGYAADITRTYGLKPTKRQLEVHRAVVEAQREIIALLGPDTLVAEYIARADEIMKNALIHLGLLKDKDDNEQFRRYFPHAVSHGLGIDVHDSLGAPRYFRAGMVLTVEPGVYIAEEGIGVRIEDDILITDKGHEILSRAIPVDL